MRQLRMERVLMGKQVIYFTAPWCGPCRVFGPTLSRVTTELGIGLVKVNVDDHADLAEEFGVQSIPTVIVMDDGQEKTRLVGAQAESAIRSALS